MGDCCYGCLGSGLLSLLPDRRLLHDTWSGSPYRSVSLPYHSTSDSHRTDPSDCSRRAYGRGIKWFGLVNAYFDPSWILISSIFHDDISGAFVYRLGLTFNAFGIYFLLRVFCQSVEDVEALCRFVAILLIPIAIEMLYEKISGYNLFSELGGVSAISQIREGKIRASGPFAHPILAGTIGAVSLPLLIGIWRQISNSSQLRNCCMFINHYYIFI